MKTPDVDTETKSKEVEDQNKKLKSKDNITCTTENKDWNNKKEERIQQGKME